jgi:SulP family sulfate permease
MAGAGLLIAIGQLGNFVGAPKRGTDDQSVLVRTWLTLSHAAFSPASIILGAGTILAILVLHKAIVKYKLPRVDMLLGLLIATFAAAVFGWSEPGSSGKTVVAVVGAVPAALPSFHFPEITFDRVHRLLAGALAIASMGLLEALAVAKSIATRTRQPLDYNRQCLAEGVGNVVGGFFQALPGSGSLTRSAINFQSGAVTRFSGAYSGVIVAIVVLLLGPYARFIPKSALAGLLFITAARLIDWKRLTHAIRASRFDAVLVLATAFTAIFISVEDSILVGVALSILLFIPRASKPTFHELIVTADGVLRERQPGEQRDAEQRVLIYDLEGDLFFGAAPELERYLDKIIDETDRTEIGYVVVRMRRSRNPDVVMVEHLERFLREAQKRHVMVLLAGVRPDLMRILENVRLTEWFPNDQIFPEETTPFSATLHAVRRATQLARERRAGGAGGQVDSQGSAGPSTQHDAMYHLVS